jgi:hypothetical protein
MLRRDEMQTIMLWVLRRTLHPQTSTVRPPLIVPLILPNVKFAVVCEQFQSGATSHTKERDRRRKEHSATTNNTTSKSKNIS